MKFLLNFATGYQQTGCNKSVLEADKLPRNGCRGISQALSLQTF